MDLDVAIIGAGMAGGTLARQLRQRYPRLRIAMFDRFEELDGPGYKVGESTSEIASSYLAKKLGLSSYLYRRHLPKNGLRFFFDDDAKSLSLPEMSEIGTKALPYHPSFQLDRSRLDVDLRQMNLRDGVQVHEGTRVCRVSIGRPHRLEVRDARGAQQSVTARWVVDASGRSRVLSKALGLPKVSLGHDIASSWLWLSNVTDPDSLGPRSWRRRVNETSRFLSTMHFMYPGYWFWVIPLPEGVTSVGVVTLHEHFDARLRKPQALLDFCRQHRALGSLLEHASVLGSRSMGHASYGTTRFVSPERWALVGEAAAFTDPMYSPGADFIALENDIVTELVGHDLQEAPEFERHVERSERYLQLRLAANLRLYRDLYPTLGSLAAFRLKWRFDIHSYYNLWLDGYLNDLHLHPVHMDDQLRAAEPTLALIENFGRLFASVAEHAERHDRYFAANRGEFELALATLDFVEDLGQPRTRKASLWALGRQCNDLRRAAVASLGSPDERTLPLYAFMSAKSLLPPPLSTQIGP